MDKKSQKRRIKAMKDMYSEHLLIFEADDVNDEDWKTVIKCLEQNLPNFKTYYADGNFINFRWSNEQSIQKNNK